MMYFLVCVMVSRAVYGVSLGTLHATMPDLSEAA